MIKKARHLITTADERTWKFDRPVLFLGEWCKLYDRSDVWKSMNGEVAAPFGLEAAKKINDIDYLNNLSTKLLNEVTEALNAFHNTSHTARYWNILLGHWLQRHVDVCFNRYFTIEQALKNYKIVSTSVFVSEDYNLATLDSESFVMACNNDVWNNVLYAQVLQHLSSTDVDIDLVHLTDEESYKQEKDFLTTPRFSVKRLTKVFSNYILPVLSRKNDAFIINSYLPRWQQVELQLALWQCPQLWQSPPLKPVSININVRKGFTINDGCHTGFEKFVRNLLPSMIPTCYLEGYSQLNHQAESIPWPKKPKFIFTSNNFDTDEIFKAWVGIKTEQGVPYFTGQHGNNYGTLLATSNRPELVSSDKFFTWGWTNDNIKNIPAFVFKIANHPREAQSDGGLVLIECHAPHQLNSYDAYSEFDIYQEQQFRFVEALPRKIQNELTVRLHSTWRRKRWSDDKRWSDRMPSVHLETGEAPIQKLLAKSRLVVHSYDSTGILESLASNIPTLCFWDGGLNYLLPCAKPYYEILRDVGILADSSEQAAFFVTENWDNIDGWWKSEQVQSARRVFCEQFARIEKHPVWMMKRLLKDAVTTHKYKREV